LEIEDQDWTVENPRSQTMRALSAGPERIGEPEETGGLLPVKWTRKAALPTSGRLDSVSQRRSSIGASAAMKAPGDLEAGGRIGRDRHI